MKKAFAFAAVVFAFAAAALASDESDLRQLDRELVVATYNNDSGWFEKHLSDDYVLITSRAGVKSRADLLKELATPGLKIEPYEPAEVTIKLYGDTAVIQGRIVQKYTLGGDRIEADLRYTDVWVKGADGWKNVAGHASAVSVKKEKA